MLLNEAISGEVAVEEIFEDGEEEQWKMFEERGGYLHYGEGRDM
jgi:hypothetical protein